MKYKHDSMLPAHAFQVRGSVIGGRGMRLHGDSDDWWQQAEPEGEGYWSTTGGGESDGMPIWVSHTETMSPWYQPKPVETVAPLAAPPVAAPAPIAAPSTPAPAAPAFTPFDPNKYGYTDDSMGYSDAARLANWHMSRGDPGGYAQQFIDRANAYEAERAKPYRTFDSYNDGNPSTTLVTPYGEYAVNKNEDGSFQRLIQGSGGGESDGTPSYSGNSFTLEDLAAQTEKAVTKPFGTGMGPAMGYAYEMKNSEGDVFRRFDAQGNLTEFTDQHGQWQPASIFKPAGATLDENGQLLTMYETPAGVARVEGFQPNKYHEDQGGWLGEGGWSRMAGLVAAGLSAGVAGGAFAGAGLGSAFGSGVAAVNPILTSAVQGALIGTASSGLQGAAPADMLKSAVIGGISAGAGSAISGAGLGTVGNIAARTGLQTGLTAISGGDVGKAAISGIINGVLPVALTEILPADTMSAFNNLPDSVKKVVMSTAGSVLNAGFNGQDISDAATNGVINGMISLGKDYAKGAFNNLTESDLAQTIKGYFNPSSTAGDFTGGYETSAIESTSQPDVIDDIFRQDADEAFNRNVPPPLVQDTINRNTPVTAETVITPPLIQTAMDQTNPDDVYRELVAGYENPYSASSLGTLASATTSDVEPVALPTTTVTADFGEEEKAPVEGRFSVDDQALTLFNEILQEEGRPDLIAESLSDPRLLDFVNRANARIESSNTNVGSLPSAESTASAIDAFVQAGGDTRAISSAEGTQSPEYAVTEAFKAFFGRNPTDIELNTFAPSEGERLAPQEYLKNVFDYAQQEQRQQTQDTFVEFIPNTPVPPPLVQEAINQNVEQVKPEKVEPEKAEKRDTKAGGSGTQGGALAGDQGRVGAAAPLAAEATDATVDAAAALATLPQQEFIANESESVVSELAALGAIDPADIPIVTVRLTQNSKILNVTPTVAVTTGLVEADGNLSEKGVTKVATETGLSPAEVADAVQGSSTIEAGTGSGLKSTGAGAAVGAEAGVSGDEGVGGRSGEGVGGQGTGVGTGVGAGQGTGSGGGLPSSGGSFGGARLTINPQFPGALPGALEGTYLKGVEVDEYDPFANYNVYQQLEPVRAADGGSPLQLAQMQQGIVGYDPSSYRNVQLRQMPDYFTYGSKPQQPTTFAGSQLMGKPKPSIPVTPTGNVGASDWLYGAAGSNQLSPAGAALPPLASGMMANGGQAQQSSLDEHIPEFVTGKTGNYVKGRGTGQSDEIPAMLADGEWVADADVVAALGDGSSDAGAELLDAFRHVIRDHKRSAPSDKIPPAASPLEYMKEALKRTGRLNKGANHG